MSLRVFLTGGTGYVGSAVLEAAIRAGHQVTAIARDPEKVEALNARGATGLLAALDTPKRYMEAVLESEVVMHTALEDSPRGAARREGYNLLRVARDCSHLMARADRRFEHR